MTESTARELYAAIMASGLEELRNDLLRYAISYARIRCDWRLADSEHRVEMDRHRSLTHDTLIDACNILSRNQAKMGGDNSWRARLGTDRREIGDLACWIHAFLGIEAR